MLRKSKKSTATILIWKKLEKQKKFLHLMEQTFSWFNRMTFSILTSIIRALIFLSAYIKNSAALFWLMAKDMKTTPRKFSMSEGRVCERTSCEVLENIVDNLQISPIDCLQKRDFKRIFLRKLWWIMVKIDIWEKKIRPKFPIFGWLQWVWKWMHQLIFFSTLKIR